ncbi:integral membrane protein [Streptomyces albus]|nr:integral membrane protein [Streptomyces albus]AYN37619.1 integral membrane protein [Streptomyces albus]
MEGGCDRAGERGHREKGVAMPGSTKAMGVVTVGTLVLVTAYTVALGSNGWLWFGWVMLGLITVGMVASQTT